MSPRYPQSRSARSPWSAFAEAIGRRSPRPPANQSLARSLACLFACSFVRLFVCLFACLFAADPPDARSPDPHVCVRAHALVAACGRLRRRDTVRVEHPESPREYLVAHAALHDERLERAQARHVVAVVQRWSHHIGSDRIRSDQIGSDKIRSDSDSDQSRAKRHAARATTRCEHAVLGCIRYSVARCVAKAPREAMRCDASAVLRASAAAARSSAYGLDFLEPCGRVVHEAALDRLRRKPNGL